MQFIRLVGSVLSRSLLQQQKLLFVTWGDRGSEATWRRGSEARIGGDLGALAHLNPFMPKAKGLARCTALPSIENSLRAPFWGAVILYRSDIIRSFLLLQRPRKAKAFFHPSVVPSPLSFSNMLESKRWCHASCNSVYQRRRKEKISAPNKDFTHQTCLKPVVTHILQRECALSTLGKRRQGVKWVSFTFVCCQLSCLCIRPL